MIKIVAAQKYDKCLSCGKEILELLRVFSFGRNERNYSEITLCTECLGELVKQGILFQPREVKEND